VKLLGRRRSTLEAAMSDEQRARALGLADMFPGAVGKLPSIDPTDRWPVSRAEAESVPAVEAALVIIAGRGSTLPLRRWGPSGDPIEPGSFIRQPEPDDNRPLQWTLLHTIRDMALLEHAYWRVLLRDSRGFPISAVWIPNEDVAPVTVHVPGSGTVTVAWRIGGEEYPLRDVIAFTGPVAGGWCGAGSRIIRTAMALERAARRYAEEPLPQTVLKNTSGVDLPEPKVEALLDQWRKGRQDRTTAYLNSAVDMQNLGWAPRDMQLVEGRQQVVMEISRLSGIPSGLLGAAASGTSLTYRNIEGERNQAYEGMLPFLAGIETRLSMGDVTPRGQSVRFDLSALTRPDMSTVISLVRELALGDDPLLTREEGRAMIGVPRVAPAGDEPAALLPTPGSAPVD
jgi:hypothetical protein